MDDLNAGLGLAKDAVREELLSEIIARYLDVQATGYESDRNELLLRYPEFEVELREFFDNEDFMATVIDVSRNDRFPRLGADYEILGTINNAGGQGVVYKAHQKSLNKIVAIKVPHQSAVRFDPEGIRKEAQKAARLRHPNIVPAHHVGDHEGQQFFVMDYIEGQSLARLIENGPLSTELAAEYSGTIAQAIHYAHQREILHCDLKPGNVLLDEQQRPYVTDFGMAKPIGEGGKYKPYGFLGGTAGYMAPEQICGEELTTGTDVYGLGALLYALLTGRPPFRAETLQATLRLVREEPPLPPRSLNASIGERGMDLEAICMKCLRKKPDQRYASAYGMAADLMRFRRGEETTARRWNRSERTNRWFHRNPILASLIAAVSLVSVLALALNVSNGEARKHAQVRDAVQNVSHVAGNVAKADLLHLLRVGRTVETAATDSQLSALLTARDSAGLQRYLMTICSAEFVSCSVFDANGLQVAGVRDSFVSGTTESDFHWRDYFLGAKKNIGHQGSGSVYLSRVYHSKTDTLYKAGLSAPVVDSNRNFVGVILTSLTTDAGMGIVQLDDIRQKVVIVGPKDNDSDGSEISAHSAQHSLAALIHPAYGKGDPAVSFPNMWPQLEGPRSSEELDDSEVRLAPQENYVDPVSAIEKYSEYRGNWIAGFAPIGNTGFVVIVQQRSEDVLALDPSIFRSLISGSAAVIILGTTIIILGLWFWNPRSHTRELHDDSTIST